MKKRFYTNSEIVEYCKQRIDRAKKLKYVTFWMCTGFDVLDTPDK